MKIKYQVLTRLHNSFEPWTATGPLHETLQDADDYCANQCELDYKLENMFHMDYTVLQLMTS